MLMRDVPRLSWWEIAEAYVEARDGVSVKSLAPLYSCSPEYLVKCFRRFEDEALARGMKVEPIEINTGDDTIRKYWEVYRVVLDGDDVWSSDD
jgi:hypothetical protein